MKQRELQLAYALLQLFMVQVIHIDVDSPELAFVVLVDWDRPNPMRTVDVRLNKILGQRLPYNFAL
jgi:hypothetical protein